MSKRTISVCDRHSEDDEVRADETVVFATAEGKYEIDLCLEHVEQWRTFTEALQEWVAAARTLEHNPAATPRRRSRSNAERIETRAIRLWAKDLGLDLGERGRISDDLRRRYRDEVGAQARERWTELAQVSVRQPAAAAS